MAEVRESCMDLIFIFTLKISESWEGLHRQEVLQTAIVLWPPAVERCGH